jgi:hypothetical protein
MSWSVTAGGAFDITDKARGDRALLYRYGLGHSPRPLSLEVGMSLLPEGGRKSVGKILRLLGHCIPDTESCQVIYPAENQSVGGICRPKPRREFLSCRHLRVVIPPSIRIQRAPAHDELRQ